jgi:hypothetical protein
MAASFIEFDKASDVGRTLARGLQMVREGRDTLLHARAIMIQMRDGDGTQSAHYDVLAGEAKASFDEVDSLLSKIATDASVSAVNAAIDQACAKHGV